MALKFGLAVSRSHAPYAAEVFVNADASTSYSKPSMLLPWSPGGIRHDIAFHAKGDVLMFNRGLFSSMQLDWATPRAFYQALDAEFGFNLDACAENSTAKCHNFYTGDEGLRSPWLPPTFVNPPYGRKIGQWVERAYEQSQRGITVVALIPSRTDTRWWHEYVMKASEIRFIRGRLKFEGAKFNAPFPSAVVIWRRQ